MAFTVYVSSTWQDLRDYQIVAREAISRMGMIPMLWEDFGILDNYEFTDTIANKMRDAHAFVGIYAFHYGYYYEQHGMSAQEFEYHCAIERGLPCLIFVVPEDASWPVNLVDRGENAARLQEFRRKLLDHAIMHHFSTPDQFRASLYLSLQHVVEAKQEREGILTIQPMFGAPSKKSQYECDIFMVMPFAPECTDIYRNHIESVVLEMKLSIKRGDDFFSSDSIMDEIWAAINASRVVIGDCTGKNANVFYELGIAHTLGKPVIMITQNIQDTPFDLRHLRIIQYDNSPDGLRTLAIQLRAALARFF